MMRGEKINRLCAGSDHQVRKRKILQYRNVLRVIGDGRTHLLLGNGFSIACDPVFDYNKLYDAAISAGLSDRAKKVFERIGTNNFEAVMRLLDDGHWLAQTYDLLKGKTSELLQDLRIIKKTLVEAIAKSHLDHTGCIESNRKDAAMNFLKPYHNVFCCNYDLLLYWVNMHAGDPPPYEDGFRTDSSDPTSETLVFSERLGDTPGMFYVHGALHLYVGKGGVRKHCWERSGTRLTELIRTGLEKGDYPLFVAEGSYEKKLDQIMRNGYLSYCLGKLGRVQGKLVCFGFSFGVSDRHIENVISDNIKITEVYIGLFGKSNSKENQAIISAKERMINRRNSTLAKRKKQANSLSVAFYNSATAKVWG